jgi:O-antigen/teichoic acid export membrane protein
MKAEEAAGSSPPVPGGGEQGSVARNAFYLVLGQVATTALSLVLSAALGRLLGAVDFGLLYLMTTTTTFAFVFVEWGQPVLVIREIAKNHSRAGELLGTALVLRVLFAVATLAPVWMVATALGYDGRTHRLSILLILASLPLFLSQAYSMAFRARDRMSRDAVVSVSNKAFALLISLPALQLGFGILGVVFAQAVAGFVGLGVAILLYRRLGATPLRVSRGTARELITDGVPILAMTAAISIQPYLDAIILSKLAPANVIGWFGAARNILGTLMAPAVILGAAAYPRLARASAEPGALRREVRAAFRPLLWLGALAGTGTYLFARTVIELIYGSRGFGPAATILEVFAPGLFLLFVDILLGNIIYASGGGNAFAVAKIVSVLIGTGLDVVLIPIFQARYGNGGIGVVVAFALSEFVVFAGAMVAFPRRTLTSATAVDVGRALGAAGLTVLLFRLIPALPAWAGIPLCVAVFAGISLALGLIDKSDLTALTSLLSRKKADPPVITEAGP